MMIVINKHRHPVSSLLREVKNKTKIRELIAIALITHPAAVPSFAAVQSSLRTSDVDWLYVTSGLA